MKAYHTFLAVGVAGGLMLAQPARATENGNEHYPIGLMTASGSVMPAPGTAEFYNYDAIYSADRFNDGQGNKLMPQFNLDVKVQASRLNYTWPGEHNGFSISSSAALNAFDTSLSIDGAHGHAFQLADTDVAPIMVQWTDHKTLHITVAPNFWLPTGAYNPTRVVNAGLNYYSMDLEAGATWTPSPDVEIGIDTWTGFSLSRNSATNYRSGNTFAADFIVGWKPLKAHPQLQIGLQGDIFRQFSDDTVNGASVGSDGFRGQQMALGPQVRWNFGPGKGLLFKYQREFDVRNRPEGNKFWLEFALPIGRKYRSE